MTVYAITDTKKGRTGIAPTYLQTTRNILHHVKREGKLSGRGNGRGICPGGNVRIRSVVPAIRGHSCSFSRRRAAVVRLPRTGRQSVSAADWSTASGYRGDRHATSREPNCQSCLQHTHTPTGHHRHRLRIINVATQCTNHCRATCTGEQVPARTVVQMTASNCAAACRADRRFSLLGCSIIYYDNFLVGHKRT